MPFSLTKTFHIYRKKVTFDLSIKVNAYFYFQDFTLMIKTDRYVSLEIGRSIA